MQALSHPFPKRSRYGRGCSRSDSDVELSAECRAGGPVTRPQFSNFDPQFVQNRLLSSSTSAPQSVHTNGSSADPLGIARPQAPQNRWSGLADRPHVGHFRAMARRVH